MTALETFVDSSHVSCEFFCFCTDKIVSIEWRDLVPRQRIGDCSGITSFVEDFVIRCHHVTKLFCSWNRSLVASSARNLCNFGSQAYVAISVFWRSRCCASVFLSPLLKHHLPNRRSLFQRNVRAHVSPGPPD